MKLKNVDELIDLIRTLQLKLKINEMRLPPGVAGLQGEFLVWKILNSVFSEKGYEVIFNSGHSRADIQLIKNGVRINIEVKTSRYKKEWYGSGYGYALNIKKCKLHTKSYVMHPKKGKVFGDFCYFDFIVAVLLSDDLKISNFFVFPRSLIEANESELRNINPRFSSSTHRMIFIGEIEKSSEITTFDKKLSKERDRYRNRWDLIK